MTVEDRGTLVDVRVTAAEIEEFNHRWPGSEIPATTLTFTYDQNHNLVDIEPDPGPCEGLMSLSLDAEQVAWPEAVYR